MSSSPALGVKIKKIKKPTKFLKSQTWLTNAHDCLNASEHIFPVHFGYRQGNNEQRRPPQNGTARGQGRWRSRELLRAKQNPLWQDELAEHAFNCQGRRSTGFLPSKEHQGISIVSIPFPDWSLVGLLLLLHPRAGVWMWRGAQISGPLLYGSLDNVQLPLDQVKKIGHYLEDLDLEPGPVQMEHWGEQMMDGSGNGWGHTHTYFGDAWRDLRGRS